MRSNDSTHDPVRDTEHHAFGYAASRAQARSEISMPASAGTLDAAGFAIRALDVARDVPTLHRWFIEERAAFWNMRDKRVDEVAAFYRAMESSAHAHAWVGMRDGALAFLFESYDPAQEEIGEHYDVLPGDLGMHLFIGPAARPIPGYSRRVFAALMRFLFERLDARRIVVEPDARNTRIHALNRAMGFIHTRQVAFRDKTAALAFCTRPRFQAALNTATIEDLA